MLDLMHGRSRMTIDPRIPTREGTRRSRVNRMLASHHSTKTAMRVSRIHRDIRGRHEPVPSRTTAVPDTKLRWTPM